MSLIWLASYPKSGSTWTRVFLANYILGADTPIKINQIPSGWSHLMRGLFDQLMSLPSSDMVPSELDHYRNLFHQDLAKRKNQPVVLKSHEAYRRFASGQSFFGPMPGCKVVHLVRGPLDVAVSYAHHNNRSVAKTLQRMADPNATMSGGSLRFLEHMGSWSTFNQSWLDQDEIPRLTLKYEDMLRTPEACFAELLQFIGLDVDPVRLERAIWFSRFDEMKQQENETGFAERSENADSFFRQGQSNAWQSVLSSDQVDSIVTQHGTVMARFGYNDHQDCTRANDQQEAE